MAIHLASQSTRTVHKAHDPLLFCYGTCLRAPSELSQWAGAAPAAAAGAGPRPTADSSFLADGDEFNMRVAGDAMLGLLGLRIMGAFVAGDAPVPPERARSKRILLAWTAWRRNSFMFSETLSSVSNSLALMHEMEGRLEVLLDCLNNTFLRLSADALNLFLGLAELLLTVDEDGDCVTVSAGDAPCSPGACAVRLRGKVAASVLDAGRTDR